MGTHSVFVGFSSSRVRDLIVRRYYHSDRAGYDCAAIHPYGETEFVQQHFRKGDWCMFVTCVDDLDRPCTAHLVGSCGPLVEPEYTFVRYYNNQFRWIEDETVRGGYNRIPVLLGDVPPPRGY